jgi:hypothetical protein
MESLFFLFFFINTGACLADEFEENLIFERSWLKASVSGLAGFETYYEKAQEPSGPGEFRRTDTLVEAEIEIFAEITERLGGRLAFTIDSEQCYDTDEALVTLANQDEISLYVSIGLMDLPFGNYETNMLTDPLTLELAETNRLALELGFGFSSFYGSFYIADVDVDRVDNDSDTKNLGVSGGFSFAGEDAGFDISFGWVSNLADSDGIEEFVREEGLELKDSVASLCANGTVIYGPVTLILEYVGALDDLILIEEEEEKQIGKSSAWNLELGYTFVIMDTVNTIGISYQGTRHAEEIIPKRRFGGGIWTEFWDHVSVGFEYFREIEYDDPEEENGDLDRIGFRTEIEF